MALENKGLRDEAKVCASVQGTQMMGDFKLIT